MRVINVVRIDGGSIISLDSFGIFEEQLSDDVVTPAEELFKKKVLELADCDEDEFPEQYSAFTSLEDCVEDGYFEKSDGVQISSVSLVWSDI